MSECPWNGCNRMRGIEFPNLAKINTGFYTGDLVANRKILVGFSPTYISLYRIILGSSCYQFIKTLNMTEWECVYNQSGVRQSNGIKILDDGFELNNGGLYTEVNRQDYGYDWIVFAP